MPGYQGFRRLLSRLMLRGDYFGSGSDESSVISADEIYRLASQSADNLSARSLLRQVQPFCAPDGIVAKYYAVRSRDDLDYEWSMGVVSFHGHIPDGSMGHDHAEFVKLECMKAMVQLGTICLILDFRDVEYSWGNDLLGSFDEVRRRFHYDWYDLDMEMPIKLLVSHKSTGLRSLIPSESLFFETIEDAIHSCEADMQRWDPDYSGNVS